MLSFIRAINRTESILTIIFRYLTRQVLVNMLAVSGVLLLVFMSARFIKYLGEAAAGDISPDVLFIAMGYRFPSFLELILPLGFFIGILLAHGRMYMESEMTVLHACGVSERAVLVRTLGAALVVMVLVGACSLYLTPLGFKKIEGLINEQRKATEFAMLVPGRFQSTAAGNRVTYTESLSDDHSELYGVFIAEFGKQGSDLSLISAKRGSQVIDDQTGSRFLVLEDGKRFKGMPGQLDYQVTEFSQYGLKIAAANVKDRILDVARSTESLWRSNDPDLRAMLHWRISLPLTVPFLTLLAVRLSRVNPRQGRFFHLLPAMLLYILYLGLLTVGRGALAKQSIPEWIGLLWVHALFLLIGLWLNFGSSLLRRRRLLHEGNRNATG